MDEFFGWSPEQFFDAQQRALMRLHLKLTGDLHGALAEFYSSLREQLLKLADSDGQLNPLAGTVLSDKSAEAWRVAFGVIRQRLESGRRQAALLGFASLPYYHGRLIGEAEVKVEARERFWEQGPILGVEPVAFFQPQLNEVLAATADRVYGDGFKLSQRIWNLDQRSLAGIRQVVAEGIATGNSAWNIAPRLEDYLGMGQDCPRWTRSRLFKLTKSDIAQGDDTGLVRGTPCESVGVAYNALRLIRNETQIVHAAATDAIFARQPWAQAEKINLSPSHPPIGCKCEDIVKGGEDSNGVYPLGEISLPIHVQCLCFKTAELISDDEFIRRLRGWMTGTEAWPEMNQYAGWVGATTRTIATGEMLAKLYTQLALPLMTWLEGSETEIEDLLS